MKTDLDFLEIKEHSTKKGVVEIQPSFVTYVDDGEDVNDVMIKDGDFYAIFNAKTGFWSTKEGVVSHMVDQRLWGYYKKRKDETSDHILLRTMKDADSGMIDKFHRYVKSQIRSNAVPLDAHILFADKEPTRDDFATRKLDYSVKEGPCPNWDKLVDKLYSPAERHKIEWFGGAVMSEASQNHDFQKCLIFHGDSGAGKSTIINVFEWALGYKDRNNRGYTGTFRSKALGGNDPFATSDFAPDHILAIEHDGDLSKIEDNTRLNSIISHEPVIINGKNKQPYPAVLRTAIIMGTNKPVKITDRKSGMIRRVIDVTPTGKKFPMSTYTTLKNNVKTELGAIVAKWIKVYEADPHYYDNYIPVKMLEETNDFYNFILDKYDIFARDNSVTLKSAWEMYNTYCAESRVPYPYSMKTFKTELKCYFDNYEDRHRMPDGSYVRSYFSGFKLIKNDIPKAENSNWLVLKEYTSSIFDKVYSDCLAQEGRTNREGRVVPNDFWANVRTTLKDIPTYRTHFVKLPNPSHIFMDFDFKDENGNKDLNRNIEEASKWPPTYAEVSQSGGGLHLHYIYDGDPLKLDNRINDNIEVKVLTGDASLRRRLTLCNDIPIAHISSGLPIKKEKPQKMYDSKVLADEKKLISQIYKAIERDDKGNVVNYHGHTAPNISLIKKWLDDAYFGEGTYDVSVTEPDIIEFGDHSTHQAKECHTMITQMHFKSKDLEEMEKAHISPSTPIGGEETRPLTIFDLETAPNHRLLCYYELTDFYKFWNEYKKKHDISIYEGWKIFVKESDERGDPVVNHVVSLIDYSPEQAEWFISTHAPIGHNCHNYDNDIIGGVAFDRDDIPASFRRSNDIINTKKYRGNYNFFGISYADTYEFPAANNRKALKWWEVKLGISHQEFNLPWDQDIPSEMLDTWIRYCKNDVIATTYLWFYLQPDFKAHEMLVSIVKKLHPECKASPNDRTNSLSQKMMFGDEKNPQRYFQYRNLGEKTKDATWCYKDYISGDPKAHIKYGLPYFPGYKCIRNEKGKLESTYRQWDGHVDEDKYKWIIGEGGLVVAEPGCWYNVKAADIQSAHPFSAIAENLLGKYTPILEELVNTRIDIKHKDYESAKKRFNGALADILDDPSEAKNLSNALKTVINSLYGESKSSFDNRFRDPRNFDNIIAKRVALFMADLYNMVIGKGYKVLHIKTDSIKILNPDEYIINEVKRMGEAYGYSLEIESHYERMCLINKAEYIAYGAPDSPEAANEWYPKGDTFKTPYIFKTLFSKEPITFDDLGETNSVSGGSAIYLDMNEDLPDVTDAEKELDKRQANQRIIDLGLQKRPAKLNPIFADFDDKKLQDYIAAGHNYIFSGRINRFAPILPGCGGGLMMVLRNDKYSAVNGSKGYRWLETETIRGTAKEFDIDMTYFDSLANDAKAQIEQFVSYDEFVKVPSKFYPDIDSDELPF